MKSLLIAVNAKYIHPNLAIRLLKKNTSYEVDIEEFTIKDNIENIEKEVLKAVGQTVLEVIYTR